MPTPKLKKHPEGAEAVWVSRIAASPPHLQTLTRRILATGLVGAALSVLRVTRVDPLLALGAAR